MDFPLLSHPDPNLRANRVPSEEELETLRYFLKRNQKIENDINAQLEEVKKRTVIIHERCERQKRIFESTLSELHASNRFIQMLETQKSIIESDLNQLYGLTNPIRRFPFELMERIFKETVLTAHDSDRFASHKEYYTMALYLSHVCTKWRDHALAMPFLWDRMPILALYQPNHAADIVNCYEQRLKGTPPWIILKNFQIGSDILELFCEAIPRIRYLKLPLDAIAYHVLGGSLKDPEKKVNVQHLHFAEGNGTGPQFSMTTIVKNFDNIQTLSIHNMDFFFNATFYTVKRLEVVNVPPLSIEVIYRCFPAIDELKLSKTRIQDVSTYNSTENSTVRSISVGSSEFPWGSFKASHLQSISIYRVDPRNFGLSVINSFIQSRAQLHSLDIQDCPEIIQEILQRPPTLQKLTIPSSEEIGNISRAEFNTIICLGLYQMTIDQLPLSLFERIVRTHWIPSGSKEVSRNGLENSTRITKTNKLQHLEVLEIIVSDKLRENELEWRSSPLLEYAMVSRRYEEEDRWGDYFTVYSIKWT